MSPQEAPQHNGGWQDQADLLAHRSLARDDPVAWFDELYAAAVAGEVDMPWDRNEPNPVLVGWAAERGVRGDGRRALVVGAGLGEDAEFVAGLGFETTAFDVSATAVAAVRSRRPDSTVAYRVANLLDPPAEWWRAFDLVVEIYTVQAMPRSVRAAATANVAGMVGPLGTLIVIQAMAPDDMMNPAGPPWPLTRAEIDAFATAPAGDGAPGLRHVEVTTAIGRLGRRQWRAEFRRRG